MTNMNTASKILIVDDDPISLMILNGYLHGPSYQIRTIDKPEKAFAVASQFEPDVILLDIMMESISGLEVCRRLKDDVSTRNIPVLFITALSDRDAHRKAIECGGEGFIVKPLDERLVRAYVRVFLRLRQTNKDVEKKLAASNEFVGMSMHDLNNMMGALTGNIELAMVENEASSSRDTYLQRCLSILKSSHETIEKLQTLVLIESRIRAADFRAVSLGELINESTWLLSTEMEEKGLRLNLPSVDQHYVRGDRNLLLRVLINLMDNAVKFAWTGSVIDVGVLEQARPQAMGNTSAGNRSLLQLTISNNCDPISFDDQRLIFDKFTRGQNAKNGTRGKGLGLAFCKLAVESFGGSIWLESPLPRQETGVAVHFTLPATKARMELNN